MEAINSIERFKWYRNLFKRIFDLLFSTIAIIALFIPMILIAIIIKLDSPKERVFFVQKRVGKNNKQFKILKFRTMKSSAPHQMATKDFSNPDMYITKIGRFLRKSSLDELPQFFNVLIGNMSIIGPRPLIPTENYVLSLRNRVNAEKVIPGITGLAQVHGRDEITSENKAKWDGIYAKEVSIKLDLKILLKTISDVLQRKGIREGKVNNKGWSMFLL